MSIIPRRKIWFIFSGTLIVLAIVALGLWGLRPSIDFIGGSLLEVEFISVKDSPSLEELSLATKELQLPSPTIQPSGLNQAVFRFPPLSEDQHQTLLLELGKKYGEIREIRFDSIGPTIGRELIRKSITAIVLVTLLVLGYIAWSFRKVSRPVPSWVYGAIVVLAFLHDTIIPLGVFAWLGEFRGVEIGSSFIAAVLTILGYSINDTIVVLDRVRENIKKIKGSFEDVVEVSVHQTINRSLNTTFTTMLVLFALYVFGGETLRVFALALLIGIFFGAYSSIFIAAPLLVVWYRLKGGR